MHRTLGDSYGTSGTKRIYRAEVPGVSPPTQVRHEEMNSLQEEICNVIEATGASLQAGTEAIDDMDQLNTAIDYKVTQEAIARASADSAINATISGLAASDIDNDSSVGGATVMVALNTLQSSIINKVIRGYLDGYNLSVDADPLSPDAWMDFSPGLCMDRLNNVPILNGASMRKYITSSWAAGHNSGGWAGSTGTPRTNFYHYCFVIYRNSDGNVDFGFDDNPNCVNLLAASGYNRYRRLGACHYQTTNTIRPFRQEGDWFYHYREPLYETIDLATGSSGFLLGNLIVVPNPDVSFGNRSEIGHDIRKVAFGISAPAHNNTTGLYVVIWPQTLSSWFTIDASKDYCDAGMDDNDLRYQNSFIVKPYPEEEDLTGRVMLLSNATPGSACNITYWCHGYEDTRGKYRS